MHGWEDPLVSLRWPRFNLLTLLVLVTAIAVAFGLFTREWHAAHRKRQAAEDIRRRGGSVSWGTEPQAKGIISGWLDLFLGDAYFAEARHVEWRPHTAEDLDLLQAFPSLESLSLRGPEVTDDAIHRLAGFRELRALQLAEAVIGEPGLEALKELPNLMSLHLSSCTISNAASERGLQLLRGLPSVQSICFENCGLSDESLQALYGPPSLVNLYLHEPNVTEFGILALRMAHPALSINFDQQRTYQRSQVVLPNFLPSVENLPQVKELVFRGSGTSDKTLAVLQDAQSLTSLWLDRCRVSDDGLKYLVGLSQLTHLLVVGTDVSDARLSQLRNEPEFLDLACADCRITDRGLESIGQLSALTDLSINNCQITDDGLRHLGRLQNLRSLWLSSPDITDAGLNALQGLTKLRYLHLHLAKITGPGLKALPASVTLLDLDATEVTDEGASQVAERLAGLEYITLSNTQVTDVGLRHLARLTSLRGLNLAHTAVTDDAVAELQRVLPSCRIAK